MEELFLDDFSSREPLSLYKRALASLLNKVFIFLLFITMCLIVFGAFTAPGDLGTYTVVLGVQPGKYDIIPSGDLMHAIDIKYTILFIITNILYYSVEFLSKASLGKRIFGGVYVDADGDEIFSAKVISRCIIFTLMMVGAVLIRFVLNLTYWNVIILFFLVNDLPVLFNKRHQSLVDIISETCLVKRNVRN